MPFPSLRFSISFTLATKHLPDQIEVMRKALPAACFYFAIVFVAGFVMGTFRTLILAPMVGHLVAVALELPVMLAVSWWACGFTVKRFAVPSQTAARTVMGLVALVLLLIAEAILSLTLGGLTLSQHAALYATAPALLGLAGQLAFAAFPVIRR
jgi:ABC-type uncharacterized transport system permease subunit